MSRNGFNDCEREYNRKEGAIEMAKEERKETDLDFVQDMEKLYPMAKLHPRFIRIDQMERLLRLAETAALIGEHRLGVHPFQGMWDISTFYENQAAKSSDLHAAVRAVAAKIGEGKS